MRTCKNGVYVWIMIATAILNLTYVTNYAVLTNNQNDNEI